MEEAADDLTKRFGEKPSPARQVKKAVGRMAGGVGGLGDRLVESIAPGAQVQENDTMAAASLAPVRRVAVTMPAYRFQGTTWAEWQAWRAEFCEQLWDLLGMGDRPWQAFGPSELKAEVEERILIDAAARLVGRTWYGLLVQDGMRAIDYLLIRPEVDPTRIGAGGAPTMYIAALDDRVQVALVSSYLGQYVITSLDEEHCPCNDIPGILRYAEMGDVAALIAPRPVMFVNGRRDPTSAAGRASTANRCGCSPSTRARRPRWPGRWPERWT